MSTMNRTFVEGMLSTPLVLPAPVAGGLAALFFVMVVLVIRRVTQGHASRIVVPVLAMAVAGVAVFGILDRLTRSERAAEERALLERNSQLSLDPYFRASMVWPARKLKMLAKNQCSQTHKALRER